MFQHLFHRHKTPKPRFAPILFLVLVAAFVLLMNSRPVLGLAGLGTTLLVSAVLVIVNRERIWDQYKKTYKKPKGSSGALTAPNRVYYNINVYMLWPFIAFLGLVCLWVAYLYNA